MENKATNTISDLTPSDLARALGKIGGDKNKANHNKEWFINLGKQGMAKRWAGHQKKS